MTLCCSEQASELCKGVNLPSLPSWEAVPLLWSPFPAVFTHRLSSYLFHPIPASRPSEASTLLSAFLSFHYTVSYHIVIAVGKAAVPLPRRVRKPE